MVKKFTIPFASQGDANDIPDALQVDGKVSFTQGFGYDYERPYDDPQAKDIAREDMNGLFKAITSAVGELQSLGASEWSNAISYPKGSIVYFEKDLYISQVDDNQNKPPQNWVSITSIANDSLKKAANLSDLTSKATARNNLGLGSSATLNKTDVLGTSTSLVATQKLVNDTKINLESSKQDKLTFVGDGTDVLRVGAGGLLGEVDYVNVSQWWDTAKSGFVAANGADDSLDLWRYGVGFRSKAEDKSVTLLFRHDSAGYVYSSPTVTTKKVFLVTSESLLQTSGDSKYNAMSQKAVTDLVKINTASKMQNGWWKCGDTGLIHQWGYIERQIGNDAEFEFAFNISFTERCFSLVTTVKQNPGNNADAGFLILDLTKTKALMRDQTYRIDGVSDVKGFFWFAIGY